MGFFGGLLGSALGKGGEMLFGKTKGIDGSALGQNLGSKLLPFKKGGAVQRLKPPAGMKKGGKVKKGGKKKKK